MSHAGLLDTRSRRRYVGANGDDYAPLGGKRSTYSLTGMVVAIAIIGLIAVLGLVFGSIAFSYGKNDVNDPLTLGSLTVDQIKVTSMTDLSMSEVLHGMWMSPPLPPARKRSKRMTVDYDVNPGDSQIVLGNAGVTYNIRFPKNLNGYVSKEYHLFSNTSQPHTVVFTGAGCGGTYEDTTWDAERQKPLAKFDAEPGAYIHFKVVDCGTVTLIESRKVDFCFENMTHCEHPKRDVNADWADVKDLKVDNLTLTTSLECKDKCSALTSSCEKTEWIESFHVAHYSLSPFAFNLFTFANETYRTKVRLNIGGSSVRIKLSNFENTVPLKIKRATIGRHDPATTMGIIPGTLKTLTYFAYSEFEIEADQFALLDSISMNVPDNSDWIISIHPDETNAAFATFGGSMYDPHVSTETGDFTGDLSDANFDQFPADFIGNRYTFFIKAVQVLKCETFDNIVVLGDSLPEGPFTGEYGEFNQWPQLLARRMRQNDLPYTVTQGSIGANTLLWQVVLFPGFTLGQTLNERFDVDGTNSSGVKHLVIQIGTTDFLWYGHPPEIVIDGYRNLILKAHEEGLKIYFCTMTPFDVGGFATFYNQFSTTINEWIRTSKEHDGYLEFEQIVSDPLDPATPKTGFTIAGGHYTSQTAQLLVNSINLDMFDDCNCNGDDVVYSNITDITSKRGVEMEPMNQYAINFFHNATTFRTQYMAEHPRY